MATVAILGFRAMVNDRIDLSLGVPLRWRLRGWTIFRSGRRYKRPRAILKGGRRLRRRCSWPGLRG